MEKYNEIQLTKNKMDLNNLKLTNHPPSPDCGTLILRPLHCGTLILRLLIIVAGKKMPEREIKCTGEKQKLLRDESDPVTSLGRKK